tara:strand:+ start:222 stop:497 length:276 start_codon:yes stop_codon:yes gene_type:complete
MEYVINVKSSDAMTTFLATTIILGFCFVGFGIGVLFFGKIAKRDRCGSVPKLDSEKDECLNQKAGLCPFEDESGGLKNAKMNQINFNSNNK